MSLQSIERDAIRALKGYLGSGYTIDVGGLIGMVAAQYSPSDPGELAQLASESPSLLTSEPDVRLVNADGLTPYALLRANVYEFLAARLRGECVQERADSAVS